MHRRIVGFGWFLVALGAPAALLAQNASTPLTAGTSPAENQSGELQDSQIDAIVRQLEQRSRLLDARQATLEEQERLLADRAQVQNERELQLREREQQLLAREQLVTESEAVLATQVPLATLESNIGVAAPGIESPAGTPTSPPAFQEPDLFSPGLDSQTFQPGVPNNFSAGPQDTRNNFISP